MKKNPSQLQSEISLLVQTLHTLNRGVVRPLHQRIDALRRQLYGPEHMRHQREMSRFTKKLAAKLTSKPSPDVATRNFKRWTARDDAAIRGNRKSPAAALSVTLGRTVRTVKQRRAKVCKKSK